MPRTTKQNHRIFLGLKEIAGFYHHLGNGFKELNVAFSQIDLSSHAFGYTAHTNNIWVRLDKFCYRRHERAGFTKPLWRFPKFMSRFLLFVWALIQHDVFIFGFATSFFNLKELRLLKGLGKKIIFVFHGSDARPPYINGALAEYYAPSGTLDANKLHQLTRKRREVISRIERFADHIINTDAQSLFFTKPFILNHYMGLPITTIETDELEKSARNTIRILHAPSHQKAKGSEIILKILDEIQKSESNIEIIVLHNATQKEVYRELARCDFVVDQLYGDQAMAGLGTEAALFGKPTIIAGYYAGLEQQYELKDFIPPVHFCQPEDMKAGILKLIRDSAYRNHLGLRALDFVRQHRTAKIVAKKYLDLIEDKIPQSYSYQPLDNSYIFGYGISKTELHAILKDYIKSCGAAALYLDHNPKLRQALLDFADSDQIDTPT